MSNVEPNQEFSAPLDSLEPDALSAPGGLAQLGEEEAAAPETIAEDEPQEKRGLGAWLNEGSVYTSLLAMALLALIIGTVCLALEMQRYGFKYKRTQVQREASAASFELPATRALG